MTSGAAIRMDSQGLITGDRLDSYNRYARKDCVRDVSPIHYRPLAHTIII